MGMEIMPDIQQIEVGVEDGIYPGMPVPSQSLCIVYIDRVFARKVEVC